MAAGAALSNPSAMALVSRVAGASSQGETMGLSHSFGSLARLLGPLAGTWAFAHLGPAWPFRAGGALMAAALLLGVVVMRWVAAATETETAEIAPAAEAPHSETEAGAAEARAVEPL